MSFSKRVVLFSISSMRSRIPARLIHSRLALTALETSCYYAFAREPRPVCSFDTLEPSEPKDFHFSAADLLASARQLRSLLSQFGSPSHKPEEGGTVFLDTSKRFSRSVSSTSTRTPGRSSKPAVEALEDRSLLDASAFVRSLYANILQRPSPTDAEVNGWVSSINSGMSLQAVTRSFLGSNEHLSLVVNNDFTTLLGRPADQAALNYFTQRMVNGMTQDQVETAILGSQEYYFDQGGTNSNFIQGVYFTALGRSADGDVAYWDNQLASGVSREQVSARIVGSHEAHVRDVDQIYMQMLNRTADDSGSDYWANALDSGRTEFDVIASLATSSEYESAYGVTPL
jgi:hypothetical protein